MQTIHQNIEDFTVIAACLLGAWYLWRNRSRVETLVEAATDDPGVTATSYPNPNGATRGYRNNNPLNIEKTATVWQGEIRPSGDVRFAQFVSMPYGYRAAFRTIRTYINNYGVKTVKAIVNRWDGEARHYVDFVCQKTGFAPDHVISPTSKNDMVALVSAMSWLENGIKPDAAVVNNGYTLYETI